MIIWNNYEYGQKSYEDKSVKTKKWQCKELKTLILYMLLNDKPPKEIREALAECCQDDIKYLQEEQKMVIFNRLINQVKRKVPNKDEMCKEKYIKSREITIYAEEIDAIKALNDKNLEQVAFVLLVYCKWLNNLKWFNMSKADIFREAKLGNLNSCSQQALLSKLIKLEYLKSDVMKDNRKYYKSCGKVQQMWSINYLVQDGEIAFVINDYNNFIYKYLNYVYGGYFMCAKCGKIFKRSSNSQKYCKGCAKKKELARKR